MQQNDGNSKTSNVDVPNMGFKLDYVQPLAQLDEDSIHSDFRYLIRNLISAIIDHLFCIGAQPPFKGSGRFFQQDMGTL